MSLLHWCRKWYVWLGYGWIIFSAKLQTLALSLFILYVCSHSDWIAIIRLAIAMISCGHVVKECTRTFRLE